MQCFIDWNHFFLSPDFLHDGQGWWVERVHLEVSLMLSYISNCKMRDNYVVINFQKCCHIFRIMLSYISNNVVIYFQLQDERQLSQNTFTGGPAWRRPLGRWLRRGSYSQPSWSSNSSRWMSSENTWWTCWSQETQNIGYPGQLVFWPVLKRLTIRVYFASIPATS